MPSNCPKCTLCGQTAFVVDRVTVEGKVLHKSCFRCAQCKVFLKAGGHGIGLDEKFYCKTHYKQLFDAPKNPKKLPHGVVRNKKHDELIDGLHQRLSERKETLRDKENPPKVAKEQTEEPEEEEPKVPEKGKKGGKGKKEEKAKKGEKEKGKKDEVKEGSSTEDEECSNKEEKESKKEKNARGTKNEWKADNDQQNGATVKEPSKKGGKHAKEEEKATKIETEKKNEEEKKSFFSRKRKADDDEEPSKKILPVLKRRRTTSITAVTMTVPWEADWPELPLEASQSTGEFLRHDGSYYLKLTAPHTADLKWFQKLEQAFG